MEGMLNIAVKACREAAIVMLRSLHRLDSVKVREKELNDFVTNIDLQSEEVITDIIRKHYPSHAINSEELGHEGEDETVWIIDPLDGTNNFLHGFPHFSISIGIQHKGQMQHGVIFDPLRQELFTASRGNGAKLNNSKIRVSKTLKLTKALINMAAHCQREDETNKAQLKRLESLMTNVSGIRISGSAALDLAYVACGRIDAFWEKGLKPWDVSAGSLLIEEAGGMISDFSGGNKFFEGEVIAGNPKIHLQLLSLIK